MTIVTVNFGDRLSTVLQGRRDARWRNLGAGGQTCQDWEVRRLAPALLLISFLAAPVSLYADEATRNRVKLVLAIRDYRESLERVRELDEVAVLRVRREIERRRELGPRAVSSLRDLEERERALAAAEQKLEATRRQILEADHAIMEVLTERRVIGRRAPADRLDGAPTLVRHRGHGRWSLAETPKVQEFFARRFGRPLPVSAFGQTILHDRLGLDHHGALDVALLPDSVEGTALMDYLRSAGISFRAYRASVPGEATGAHIHIGEPSPRF